MGVAWSVIGRGVSWERPRVQSGDFRLGGQSGGEEKSAWSSFYFLEEGAWIRAQLLTRRISGCG